MDSRRVSDTREYGRKIDTRENTREKERAYSYKTTGEEGWIPVIGNQRRQYTNNQLKKEMVTLFIDNIPDDRDQQWLCNIFNKYGVVRDAFIPNKKSKHSGNRFGFVRFASKEEAERAITRLNGIWIGYERLLVKEASFGQQTERRSQKKKEVWPTKEANAVQNTEQVVGILNRKVSPLQSYANAVKGEATTNKGGEEGFKQRIQIKVNQIGNGWLFRSAIAVLRRIIHLKKLEDNFKKEHGESVKIRAMGGRKVIITFMDSKQRDEQLKGTWMERWFENSSKWNGDPASFERFVWLQCKGIPLNAWNAETFKRIGETWGDFICTGGDTIKERTFSKANILIATEVNERIDCSIQVLVNGIEYSVKVTEEFTCDNPDDAANRLKMENLMEVEKTEGFKSAEEKEQEVEDKDDVDKGETRLTNENTDNGNRMGRVRLVENVMVGNVAQKNGASNNRGQGSIQAIPEEDLLLSQQSENFESYVEDSMVNADTNGPNVVTRAQAKLAQEKYLEMEVNTNTDTAQIGAQMEKEAEQKLREKGETNPEITIISSSQRDKIPSIDLVVDLQNAECRKRRRRQMVNLLNMQEEIEEEEEEGSSEEEIDEESSSQSTEVEDQRASQIVAEVRATLAVAAQIDMNFSAEDTRYLKKMIEKEYEDAGTPRGRGGS